MTKLMAIWTWIKGVCPWILRLFAGESKLQAKGDYSPIAEDESQQAMADRGGTVVQVDGDRAHIDIRPAQPAAMGPVEVDTVQEMKRQGAAAVALFFDVAPDNPNMIDIVLRNVGLRPAHHIEITPVDGSQPLTSNACRANAAPDNLGFPFKPVVLLPPGGFYRRPFYDRTRGPQLDLDYRVTLSWGDGLIGRVFAPPQDMTLRGFIPDIETGF